MTAVYEAWEEFSASVTLCHEGRVDLDPERLGRDLTELARAVLAAAAEGYSALTVSVPMVNGRHGALYVRGRRLLRPAGRGQGTGTEQSPGPGGAMRGASEGGASS
jgi:hypothetical protein